MAERQRMLYVAACDVEKGGIFRFRVEANGQMQLLDSVALREPKYMAMTDHHIHVVLRRVNESSDNSGAMRLAMDADGRLHSPSDVSDTHGVEGCHILVDGDDVYIANYMSGSIIKMLDTLVIHEGRSVHETRQEAAHTHQAAFTNDKRFVCVPDLGLDRIIVYDRKLSRHSEVALPPGSGPRHMLFSADGSVAYCVNELQSTVSVFSHEEGTLTYEHTVDALPRERSHNSTAAAIRLSRDGQYLYTSNRGDDSISCFRVDGEQIERFAIVSCGGASPRDFIITDDDMLMAVCNEASHNVALFAMEDGLPRRIGGVDGVRGALCALWRDM